MKLIFALCLSIAPTVFLVADASAETCQERCYRIHGWGLAGDRCAAKC